MVRRVAVDAVGRAVDNADGMINFDPRFASNSSERESHRTVPDEPALHMRTAMGYLRASYR